VATRGWKALDNHACLFHDTLSFIIMSIIVAKFDERWEDTESDLDVTIPKTHHDLLRNCASLFGVDFHPVALEITWLDPVESVMCSSGSHSGEQLHGRLYAAFHLVSELLKHFLRVINTDAFLNEYRIWINTFIFG
jgi:hypothetical protein